ERRPAPPGGGDRSTAGRLGGGRSLRGGPEALLSRLGRRNLVAGVGRRRRAWPDAGAERAARDGGEDAGGPAGGRRDPGRVDRGGEGVAPEQGIATGWERCRSR